MNAEISDILTKLGLEQIPTQDNANKEKPVHLKLQQNPDVSFAIVLLSGDDFAFPKNGNHNDALLRASQNIVFEFGYLLAALGRENVLAICYEQKSFRRPSQFSDAIYVPYYYSNTPFKKQFIRRLQEKGFKIDTSEFKDII